MRYLHWVCSHLFVVVIGAVGFSATAFLLPHSNFRFCICSVYRGLIRIGAVKFAIFIKSPPLLVVAATLAATAAAAAAAAVTAAIAVAAGLEAAGGCAISGAGLVVY